MKICIMSYRFFTGGLTSSLIPLVRSLQKRNIDVDVMLFDNNFEFNETTKDLNIIINSSRKKKYSVLRIIPRIIIQTSALKKITKYLFKFIFYYLNTKINNDDSHNKSADYYFKKIQMTYGQAATRALVNLYTGIDDLSNYDHVIAWEEGFVTYFLADKVIAKNKISYIHPDYKKAMFDNEIDGYYLEKINNICFVSNATKQSFDSVFPQFIDKSIVIYNLLDVKDIKYKSNINIPIFTKSDFDIITVCRLDNKSKAINRGIEIISKLISNGYKIIWYIAGEGPSEREIKKLINYYKMEDNIILLGNQTNPHPYTRKADLFMLQSYYEGMSLSVEEAKIIGTPVLITNFASAKEQVEDNVTGFISENDTVSIYNKLCEILNNKDQLDEVRKNLRNMNYDKYYNNDKFISLLEGGKDAI